MEVILKLVNKKRILENLVSKREILEELILYNKELEEFGIGEDKFKSIIHKRAKLYNKLKKIGREENNANKEIHGICR